MRPKFVIEGNVCFMTCPPGLEPMIQLYDLYPDGSRRYTITEAPRLPEFSAAVNTEEEETA